MRLSIFTADAQARVGRVSYGIKAHLRHYERRFFETLIYRGIDFWKASADDKYCKLRPASPSGLYDPTWRTAGTLYDRWR